MSLKQRLLVFVAVLLVAAVALLSGLSYWQMRTEIVVGVDKEIDSAIRGNREALSRWLAQRRDAIDATRSTRQPTAWLIPVGGAGHEAGRWPALANTGP